MSPSAGTRGREGAGSRARPGGDAVATDPPERAADRALAEHFQDIGKQVHAATLGMWIFLAGELLLFSALFTLYAGTRLRWPEAFARGAGETVLWMGSAGTFVLLGASFLVAWAVHAVRRDRGRAAGLLLWAAAVGGAGFLVLKGWEWWRHAREGVLPGRWLSHGAGAPEGGTEAFWNLYYLMTGLHGLHVLGGVALLAWLGVRVRRGAWDSSYHAPVELGGMYWHLVDVVWLFLWPFFYLMR